MAIARKLTVAVYHVLKEKDVLTELMEELSLEV